MTLITIDSLNADFFPVHRRVERIGINLAVPSSGPVSALILNIKRVYHLRKSIKILCPDVVISFMNKTNALVLISIIGLGVPAIISERIFPPRYPLNYYWKSLCRLLYPKADALVVQTDSIARWAETLVKKNKIFIVQNPLCFDATDSVSFKIWDMRSDENIIIAIGRLEEQKGFDLLLDAFSKVIRGNENWSLWILGEGPDREKLERQAKELSIEKKVKFHGLVSNIHDFLPKSDIFVLSSRFEGFPNALLEAMSCGLPSICFDCSGGGPRAIIRNNIDGLLVASEDTNALATAMERMMSDEGERIRLGNNALEVWERFATERIVAIWDEIIDQVTERTPSDSTM